MDSKSFTDPMEPLAIPRGGGGAAEDLISGLPDELLHVILTRLDSAAAAARTSVLSRRWRGVWTHIPELVICVSPVAPATPPSALVDSVDAALNSSAAPTLDRLKIDVSGVGKRDVPANRISVWLSFASQRHAGKLRFCLDLKKDAARSDPDTMEELALPVCERATEINLLCSTQFLLRPPRVGSFSALTNLMISCGQMDGGELGRAVSSPQCPRLQQLYVSVSDLVTVFDVSIYSESLECLDYNAFNTSKLEVNAPMLREISMSPVAESCIVAPKLEMVQWSGRYDPGLHKFAASGRHLQSLYIMHSTFFRIPVSSTRLRERYDSAKELIVSLGVYKDIAGYVTFLEEMDKLPICESLAINFVATNHSLSAIMFHLLRGCSYIRKLKLFSYQRSPLKMSSCSVSGCPCLLPENYRLDDIRFDSLEEIGIQFFTGSDEQEEFMKLLLSKCNMVTLKRVNFTVPGPVSSEIKVVVERIRSVCHPMSKIQFYLHAEDAAKPLDSCDRAMAVQLLKSIVAGASY